jgi:hypothetical protein
MENGGRKSEAKKPQAICISTYIRDGEITN